MLAPDWYWYHGNSAYSHGGALVNYILRAYGPERFLKLYRNCRQATFEADLQESLGVGLDELDAAYWADVERLVASDGPPAKRWLKGMKLAPGISPAAWDAFLADYFAAAERLVAPYEHVRLSTSYRSPLTKPGSEYKEQLTLLRSGALARVRLRRYNSLASKDVVSEEAILATPEHSLFFFRNHSPEIEPWTSWEGTQVTPSQTYRRALHGAKSMAATNYNFAATHGGAVLLEIEIDNSGRTVSYEVIQLKNSTIDGKKIVTLGLRTRPETSQSDSRILTYVFAADDSFVVRSITGKMLRNGSVWNTRFEYDHRDGRPVLRSAITTTSDPRRILRLAVDECQFGPVPESEFSPESFLSSLGSSVVHRQNIEPPPTGTWLDLYWLAFVFGGLSLAGGAGLSSTGLAVRRAKVVALSA